MISPLTSSDSREAGLMAITLGNPSGRAAKARSAVRMSVSAVVTNKMEFCCIVLETISKSRGGVDDGTR